jgi:hypothetical protein
MSTHVTCKACEEAESRSVDPEFLNDASCHNFANYPGEGTFLIAVHEAFGAFGAAHMEMRGCVGERRRERV